MPFIPLGKPSYLHLACLAALNMGWETCNTDRPGQAIGMCPGACTQQPEDSRPPTDLAQLPGLQHAALWSMYN